MDLGLKEKRFLVGGASKGLGRAVAKTLAAEGARVLLMARDQDVLDKVATGIGSNASTIAVDIANPGAVDQVVAAVQNQLGGLDGVLVNAGGPPPGDVLNLSDDQWRQSFELLIGGPVRLLRALVPQISDGGAVLFITSSSVRQPIPGLDSSNVLRPGVAAMAKCLSRELSPKIRVNSLAPGRFDTDRVRSLDQSRAEARGVSVDEQKAEATKAIPLGRYGEPVELGRFGAYLLSPAASYITGAALHIDGGMITALP